MKNHPYKEHYNIKDVLMAEKTDTNPKVDISFLR
jgi:hypothetical protein